MTPTRSPYLDAFLATVDFRSPASLLEAAARLEATLVLHGKFVEAKQHELDLMMDTKLELARLVNQLRSEAGRLRRAEDFEEHPTFAEQNDARIKGDSPNPVIHD